MSDAFTPRGVAAAPLSSTSQVTCSWASCEDENNNIRNINTDNSRSNTNNNNDKSKL